MPGTSTEQVVDKGIRQKSIHSFHSIHSFPDGSAFCPGAPKRVPSQSEKHRRVYTSSNVCHSHEWRVDTASGMTVKKQNACLHAVRHAVEKKIACIHGLRSEGVNVPPCYLSQVSTVFVTIFTYLILNNTSYNFTVHVLTFYPNSVSFVDSANFHFLWTNKTELN